ncbi:kinase-like domain-containing protein [Hyaloraphidium curvatum]|nr:kinase-like domain-containing protein [Hyaloraphidium curvatum]
MDRRRRERDLPPSEPVSESHIEVAEVLENRKTGTRYARHGVLGEGGFATCYEVSELSTGKKFAAKCVPKKSIKSQKQKSKLLSEIRIHQALSHRNIVSFVEAFEDDDNVFIILELCERTTFIELLRARKRLNEDEARFYMRQLLDAVRYMHSKRIIHRDLKLGNLFLAADMSLKIGDFGLAAVLKGENDRKKTICGTPNYIAPEVLFDTENGHSYEVDIWSLGVIMYTFLIGKPPFQTRDVKSIYQKIRDNLYEFPANVPLSSAAQALITSLLTTRPDHRPAIDEIMEHEFFESEVAHTPEFMPHTIFDTPYAPPSRSGLLARPAKLPDPVLSALGAQMALLKPPSSAAASQLAQARQGRTDAERAKADPGNRDGAQPNTGDQPRSTQAPDQVKNSIPTPATSRPLPLQELSPNALDRHLSDRPRPSNLHAGHRDRPADDERQSPAKSPRPLRANSSTLSNMLGYMEACLDGSPAGTQRAFTTAGGRTVRDEAIDEEALRQPPVFVNKWIDYSHKYGLGYQLTNGCIGVFFNDSTTIILSGDTRHFEYISFDRPHSKGSLSRSCHTLSDYPADLRKKVTLLCHFQNYINDNLSKHIPSYFQLDAERIQNLDFLTKYIRTKHAVLFRLSNRVLQVNFFDHTKLVIYLEGKVISFVDQSRDMRTRTLAEFVEEGEPSVMKRIHYVRDVLRTLCQ